MEGNQGIAQELHGLADVLGAER
ncbi:uncharacterized protein METZ01_LOCUS132258 [marine metagenome]|uniref:Uncharacterized protein n=1 Tax=marine metagenome TaxID=408172 RepID=A0A381YR34_9ZZZZ